MISKRFWFFQPSFEYIIVFHLLKISFSLKVLSLRMLMFHNKCNTWLILSASSHGPSCIWKNIFKSLWNKLVIRSSSVKTHKLLCIHTVQFYLATTRYGFTEQKELLKKYNEKSLTGNKGVKSSFSTFRS